MLKKLFSFEGRIRRLNYVITVLIYVVFLFVLLSSLFSLLGAIGGSPIFLIILLILLLVFFWIIFSQGSKRCHDLGKSGWYQLIPFYVLLMLFKPGMEGNNRFGPDPRIDSRKMDDILDSSEGL